MRGRLTPYLLVLPAWVWLVVFFVLPTLVMLSLSTQTGDLIDGWRQTFNIAEFSDAIRTYHAELVRSLLYGLEATIACIVLGYPVAWWIATSAGQHKSTYLFLLLLPFFVSFVIRTVSWNFLLRDNGMVLSPLKSIGLLPQNFHVLSTPFAVVAGLTYNFLPFTVLPIYVALEKIDLRLVEAASDLYATRTAAFRRVILPLSLPGVFAAVVLTFVPAASDYVNAAILGGTGTTMIGSIIQTSYFTNADYPMAAALSFILTALLLIGVFCYAKVLGTDDVLDAAAA
jgi:spermidine/putrescine transport system permease protein